MNNLWKPLRTAALLLCSVLLAQSVRGDDVSEEQAYWKNEVQPFLQTYCADCHSGESAEADVDFDAYSTVDQLQSQRPRWNQVLGMIEIGAMPPADYDPQPSHEDRERISAWINRLVNTVDCSVTQDPGRVTVRRLNIVEYDNTLRDLLGINFQPSQAIGFPSDDVGNGFDNQGDVLTLAPLQLEKYLQAAKLVAESVVVLDAETLREQEVSGEKIFVTETASQAFEFASGKYDIKVKLEYGGSPEESVPVQLMFDGEQVASWEIKGDRPTRKTHEMRVEPGRHTVGIHFPSDPNTELNRERDRRIEIEYFRIVGPEGGQPQLPETHRRFVVAEPSESLTVRQAAEQIFEPFLLRAYRRKPTSEDVQRVVNLVELAIGEGHTFREGVRFGLQSVLVSPHFLFRVERGMDNATEGSSETLSDFALASRLSYFLWSSTPDDELLELASAGELRNPEVLEAQAARMLTSDKAAMLVDRFFGQTFGLGNLKEVDPDQDRYPYWNDRLKAAMLEETRLFCREIIRQDLPLSTLINGDFTFVNPRLAEHYGIEFEGQDPTELYTTGPGFPVRRRLSNREGEYKFEDKFVRMPLPPGRRGILTQAAILTLTSNPTSTSPVKRGKWILENIFGDPPPPAPPNVPTFEETQKEHGDLSLRQQLELHRANPSCASCHAVMDPLGLGFENFDAIGKWRDRDGTHPIDATGSLADGRSFNGSAELVSLIETRMDEVAHHFANKMLTYALGRGLEPSDFCTVDEIVGRARENDYRISSFIKSVVTSQPFTRRGQNDPAVGNEE